MKKTNEKQMKPNPELKALILEVVDNPLRAKMPPETRLTLDRLIKEGYSKQDAKELIACALTSEIYDVMKTKKEYNNNRYVTALNKLPEMPCE